MQILSFQKKLKHQQMRIPAFLLVLVFFCTWFASVIFRHAIDNFCTCASYILLLDKSVKIKKIRSFCQKMTVRKRNDRTAHEAETVK